MSGRTYVLILFFWAVLTIVTPILIHLSASAKESNGQRNESLIKTGIGVTSLPRRALITTVIPPPSLAPAPAPAPACSALCFTSEKLSYTLNTITGLKHTS